MYLLTTLKDNVTIVESSKAENIFRHLQHVASELKGDFAEIVVALKNTVQSDDITLHQVANSKQLYQAVQKNLDLGATTNVCVMKKTFEQIGQQLKLSDYPHAFYNIKFDAKAVKR